MKKMKNKVIGFIKQLGGAASYASNTVHTSPSKDAHGNGVMRIVGHERTMFIKSRTSGISADDIQNAVLDKFGYNLSFKLA